MMLKRLLSGVVMLVAAVGVFAQDAPVVTLNEVVEGINRPVVITNAKDGTDRLFVVSQGGPIYAVTDGNASLFLDLTGRIAPDVNQGGYSERGVLGLAFSSTFSDDGRFYVHYSDRNGDTVISRFTVLETDPTQGDLASEEIILTAQQPYPNHNGGEIAFGPDGYLYISLGDGGSGGDPLGNGQNLENLLGKILRIDVSTDTGYVVPESNPFVGIDSIASEIWSFGLRNVWRFSFDRATGDLYLGDVGQGQWEEINYQAADSTGGENYGWKAFEGTHVYDPNTTVQNDVKPILEYEHGNNGCSVTGGYVYNGTAMPDVVGKYIYGDFCSGNIWIATPNGDGTWSNELLLATGFPVSSFGEDEAGELYVSDHNGFVYRFE